jgi:heat shock protein HslJ
MFSKIIKSKKCLILGMIVFGLSSCVSGNIDNAGLNTADTTQQTNVNNQNTAQQTPLFDLKGTKWVSSINNLHTVEFNDEGKVTGIVGCNAYNGFYGQSVQGVTITSITATQNQCADSIMLDAETFKNLLQKVRNFHQIGQTIVLKDDANATLLVMKKQAI